jgi:hypothetical protein
MYEKRRLEYTTTGMVMERSKQLCPRPSSKVGECGTFEIDYTRGTFEPLLGACGVCDRNNLKLNSLRRGRLPSGCTHLH